MKIKKHLSFKPLVNGFKKAFIDYDDGRQEESISYPALDTALSGLACMFYQSGTMVTFQVLSAVIFNPSGHPFRRVN